MTREEALDVLVNMDPVEDMEVNAAIEIAIHDIKQGKYECENCWRTIHCKDCGFNIDQVSW